MEAVSSLYHKPFLCLLGLKCDFQNWVFLSMLNNLSCKNTLPTQKLFSFYKKNRFTASPILKVLDAPYCMSFEVKVPGCLWIIYFQMKWESQTGRIWINSDSHNQGFRKSAALVKTNFSGRPMFGSGGPESGSSVLSLNLIRCAK